MSIRQVQEALAVASEIADQAVAERVRTPDPD